MSRKMFIRPIPPSPSSQSLNKCHPLLHHSHSSASSSSSSSSCCSGRFAEVVGGTTAECAAVCCCCPCGLVNLLILTIYKVPARLCRRALRKNRRRRLMKKGLLPARARRCKCGCDDTDLQIHPAAGILDSSSSKLKYVGEEDEEDDDEEAMVKLEKKMWETFYGTGFWRSPSQREPPIRSVSSNSIG